MGRGGDADREDTLQRLKPSLHSRSEAQSNCSDHRHWDRIPHRRKTTPRERILQQVAKQGTLPETTRQIHHHPAGTVFLLEDWLQKTAHTIDHRQKNGQDSGWFQNDRIASRIEAATHAVGMVRHPTVFGGLFPVMLTEGEWQMNWNGLLALDASFGLLNCA